MSACENNHRRGYFEVEVRQVSVVGYFCVGDAIKNSQCKCIPSINALSRLRYFSSRSLRSVKHLIRENEKWRLIEYQLNCDQLECSRPDNSSWLDNFLDRYVSKHPASLALLAHNPNFPKYNWRSDMITLWIMRS